MEFLKDDWSDKELKAFLRKRGFKKHRNGCYQAPESVANWISDNLELEKVAEIKYDSDDGRPLNTLFFNKQYNIFIHLYGSKAVCIYSVDAELRVKLLKRLIRADVFDISRLRFDGEIVGGRN